MRSALRLQNAELAVVCDASDKARAKAQGLAPMAKPSDDAEKVFADPDIDAVIIASPAATHAALGRAALEAGKHVLIEKPFVLDPADGEPLVQLAESRGQVLMVGHLLRFHPYFLRLENLVETGDLGKVQYVYAERVNLGVVRSDENAFWSLAPHDVSMMCALMSAEPVEVACTGQSFLQEGIEDVVFATIKFNDGTLGHIHVSWLDPQKHRQLTVVGSKKMAVFDDMEPTEKLRIFDKGVTLKKNVSFDQFLSVRQGDIHIPSIRMVEPLLTEQQHFVDCIREKKTPVTDGREAMRVLRTMVAATKSLEEGGRPVAIGS